MASTPVTPHPRPPRADIREGMLYFFRRADSTLTCETRLDPMGNGFQLVVKENGHERIETFAELAKLLSREHELVQAWKAQGWRETSQPRRTPVDTWSGPR